MFLNKEEQKWERLINNRLNHAKKNYSITEEYYKRQRDNFLLDLQKASGLSEEEINKAFSIYMQKTIENFDYDKAYKITKSIFEKVKNEISHIGTNNIHKLRSIYNKLQKDKTDEEIKASKEYQEIVSEIMKRIYSEEETCQDIKDYLFSSFGNSISQYDIKQISGKMNQYKNQLLFAIAQGRKVKDFYISPKMMNETSGYVVEVSSYDAMLQFVEYLDQGINIKAKAIGEKNESLDEIFEIIFPSIILKGKAYIKNTTHRYGVQSKSYTLPNQKGESKKYNYYVKTDETLLKKLNPNYRHSWSATVEFLSKPNNMTEATDNAVLWRSNREFIWANDYINRMKQNYYLSFAFSNKNWEASNSIEWRKKWGKRTMNYLNQRT